MLNPIFVNLSMLNITAFGSTHLIPGRSFQVDCIRYGGEQQTNKLEYFISKRTRIMNAGNFRQCYSFLNKFPPFFILTL